MKFTLGADPELFLINPEGQYISSIGKIGGTKHFPASIGEGCAVQEDNVAVEFNIPPANTYKEFEASLLYSMKRLEARATELKLSLAIHASAEFLPDQLKSKEALEFGCEPDFNAWTMCMNPRPKASDKALRSCGGHVHVGTTLHPIDVIRAFDLFLGVPSTILDKDTRRRELYGKAGAYRPKHYGAEYRSLSNFWLKSTDLMSWVYKQAEYALNWVEENGKKGRVKWDEEVSSAIQAAINLGNKDAYMYLDKRFGYGL
jgi:Phage phiEco32-like COOH.NH2 ligase-type 2